MRKVICLLLCVLVVFGLSAVTVANADVGPHKSTRINFKNLGTELCYGTMLSSTAGYGPHFSWEQYAHYLNQNMPADVAQEYEQLGESSPKYVAYVEEKKAGMTNSLHGIPAEVWLKFVNYEDPDGYYFFCDLYWNVSETKKMDCGYYPPQSFKILLYFPERDKFEVSGVCERYAFDTYYTVDMNDVEMASVAYDESSSNNDRINPFKTYPWGEEILALIARILITIAVEMLVAALFGIRGKKAVLLILIVNTVTQILLNVFLNLSVYSAYWCRWILLVYVLSEAFVFIAEAVAYALVMPKLESKPKSAWYYAVYAVVANLASLGIGVGLAFVTPYLF